MLVGLSCLAVYLSVRMTLLLNLCPFRVGCGVTQVYTLALFVNIRA